MQTKIPNSETKRDCSKPLPMKAGFIMVANVVVMSVILAYGISTGNNVPFVGIAGMGMMIVPMVIVRLVHAGRIK